ncbi:hypothetical protein BGZ95_000398 [Linnemannia exigua]|uniref:RNI-like protein n=1 Tax=Linnemannia exigua TaxID=604196 RepID=A0AAD4H4G5_9FUNG|nr:hypothetical protein BGZ95_000398 [Linnemannia exigua]
MTHAGATEKYSQDFRIESTSKIHTIQTRLDKSGQFIVLWQDVQVVFKNAEFALDAGIVVPFLADDDFKLINPRRIIYRPGVVLDVVVECPASANSMSPPAVPPQLAIAISAPVIAAEAPTPNDISAETALMARPTLEQSMATAMKAILHLLEGSDGALAALTRLEQISKDLTDAVDKNQDSVIDTEVLETMREYIKCYNSFFQTNISGHVQAVDIKRIMAEQLEPLEFEKTNKTIRSHFARMEEQMAEQQKQALNRLVLLDSRGQAIITQTYELHEYPIPRMFIVLPKGSPRRRDKVSKFFKKPFAKEYRLYFLCDCGDHTMKPGTNIQHKIHLAKHEGYDLHRPTEFFAQYGSHVLTVMRMLQVGITVAGIVLPPLALLDLDNLIGIESLQRNLDVSSDKLGTLVDQTISLLEGQIGDIDKGSSNNSQPFDLSKTEALEGADLRQMESFLKIKDEGRTLGNLYRIVTPEGHVKWVCIDHYRENNRLLAIQRLRNAVVANGGSYSEGNGFIRVWIKSDVLAKQFYEALVQAHGVQKLFITLQWNATMEDMRSLAAAISKANITKLRMRGEYFKEQKRDFVNHGRRYDPIMQLMSNGHIQSLKLEEFNDFHRHISRSFIQPAPQLRKFAFLSSYELDDEAAKNTMTKILEHCPSLNTLKLCGSDLGSAFHYAIEKIGLFQNLEMLVLRREGMDIDIGLVNGNIQTMAASLYMDIDPSAGELQLLQNGELTKLCNSAFTEIEMHDIVNSNPKLAEMQIGGFEGCQASRIAEIQSWIRAIFSKGTQPALRTLSLEWEHFSEDESLDTINTTVTFSDTIAAFDISLDIHMEGDSYEEVAYHQQEIFRRYGGSITSLTADMIFDDDLAMLLNSSIEENGSKITTLSINPLSFTSAGLECMDHIIERSPSLEHLGLHLKEGSDQVQNTEGMKRLLRYRERVTKLEIWEDPICLWMRQLAVAFPTRRALPKLSAISLRKKGWGDLSSPNIPWLAAMFCVPPRIQCNPMRPTDSHDDRISKPCTPLSSINLTAINLEPEQWRSIMETMDFSALVTLDFWGCNFSLEQLKHLTDRISGEHGDLTKLATLRLQYSALVKQYPADAFQDIFAVIKRHAPLVEIETRRIKQ